MEKSMARSEDARNVRRIAEDIDDALEFNLPFIAATESEAWRQVHALLRLIGLFADEAGAPEPVWRETEEILQELHEALQAAVSRGRVRHSDSSSDPLHPDS
jgi:hypothetical protein